MDDPIGFSMLNQIKPVDSWKFHFRMDQALPSSAWTRHRLKPLSCPGPPQECNLPQRSQKAAGGGYLHEPPMAVTRMDGEVLTGNPESHAWFLHSFGVHNMFIQIQEYR